MMKKADSQLFATSWLGLGFAEAPITADKRLRYASPKFAYRRTSFIRKLLCAIGLRMQKYKNNEINVFRRVRK